jgi:hypothetical protein
MTLLLYSPAISGLMAAGSLMKIACASRAAAATDSMHSSGAKKFKENDKLENCFFLVALPIEGLSR